MNFIRIFIIIIAVSGLAVSGCGRKAEETEVTGPFCLTDTLQKKVEIAEVKEKKVRDLIALSGKISADEDKIVKVFPVVSGVVESMKAELGDFVKKGQTLAVIRSSEIADYQNQASYAFANVKNYQKALDASKEMFKAGLATEKEVVAAETDLEKARADLNRIKQTTSIYGARGNAIQYITSPIAGYIIEKNITDKMQYKTDGSQPFFIIANLDEVWVMANVFESDIPKIKTGYDADIKVIAYNDRTFTGKVDRIFSMLDTETRVMKVRIRMPNTGNLLKPEMFARINIHYDDDTSRLPAIPAKAVIFDKNKNYVMIYHDKCNIETREVEVYKMIGDTTYIKSGLSEGDRIISKYQLLIYDAMND